MAAKKPTTDADIVKIARKMQALQRKLTDLISEISQSDHPNAEALTKALYDECWFAAWPEHVIAHNLKWPHEWETGDYGIRKAPRIKMDRSALTKDRPYAVGGRGRRGW